MDVYIKNNRKDSIFFYLKKSDDENLIKPTELLHPGDVIYKKSNSGTMKLGISSFENKGLFVEGWEGFVPSNTSSPISIEEDNYGNIRVKIDETNIPNTLNSIWTNKNIKYAGILLLLIISLLVYRYVRKK